MAFGLVLSDPLCVLPLSSPGLIVVLEVGLSGFAQPQTTSDIARGGQFGL